MLQEWTRSKQITYIDPYGLLLLLFFFFIRELNFVGILFKDIRSVLNEKAKKKLYEIRYCRVQRFCDIDFRNALVV